MNLQCKALIEPKGCGITIHGLAFWMVSARTAIATRKPKTFLNTNAAASLSYHPWRQAWHQEQPARPEILSMVF